MENKPMTDRELIKFWISDLVQMVMSLTALAAFVGAIVIVCELLR